MEQCTCAKLTLKLKNVLVFSLRRKATLCTKTRQKNVLGKNLFLPDDASVEEREDEVEGNRTPRHKMVHPCPEMSL